MDLFEEYLNKKKTSIWVNRALTDTSYRNVDYNLIEKDTNKELATYGDAIIKLCYAEILLDKCKQLSKKIEEYVTDERFVTIIAKHYRLIENKYISIDEKDSSIKEHLNYKYEKPKKTSGGNKKDSPDKFKATAVEAMIAAIYKETKDLNSITELLKKWMNFSENNK